MNASAADTIIACCTPQGGTGGSVALLRISGPQALVHANALARLSSNQPIGQQSSHTIHHGFVIDEQGEAIDEVLFLLMHAPKTFTGEHVVEITCHANPLIINRILDRAHTVGIRLAQRGEFSQQAFINRKIDLVQAEAIQELIHASTEQSVKASLAQLSGTLSATMHAVEQRILTALSWCEASFEFVEEVGDFGQAIHAQIAEILTHIHSIQRTHAAQIQIREGIRISLIGSVNVGKSSLFNALIGKERAIVTPIAGTTRDSIEAQVIRKQYALTYIDTAGLRATSDIVEQQGMMRSWHEAEQADLVLLLLDHSRQRTEEEYELLSTLLEKHASKIIIVLTKQDLPRHPQFQSPSHVHCAVVTSITGTGIADLEHMIASRIASLYAQHQLPYLVNKRHHEALNAVLQELKAALQLCAPRHKNYELISHHLQRSLELLGEISGKTITENALDRVFREFCIGK